MSHPAWYREMAAAVEARGLDRFSPSWRAAMRDEYLTRFPDSDETSKDNMRATAELMSDMAETLFPDFEPVAVIPEPVEPVEKLSADRRRTLRQREAVGRGVHPLTRQKVSDDPAARCGNCRFRIQWGRNRSFPKCAWVPPDWSAETYERLGPPRISHSAASDVRAWWPGCRDHEWGDPKLSPDAARSGPTTHEAPNA